jgi:hypothetical protein
MPIRTTKTEVGRIIEVDDSINLSPYIEAASELVTEACGDLGYSTERLRLIEMWLSAHIYTIRDPRSQSEGAGGVSVSYQGQTGMYFESSMYGQNAMMLDTKGGLAKLQAETKDGKTSKIGLDYMGYDSPNRESR